MACKISFIIPVYNVEKYLKQCLDSIINQTLRDIEIICVNDGSTDESLNILKDYKEKDSRIIIINQNNAGQGKARNEGLDVATGEYILFVDSDDWIELNAAEELYKNINEKDLDVLIFQVINYDDEKNNFYETKYYNNAWFPTKFDNKIFNYDNIKEYMFYMACTPYSKIYKRSFIEKYKIRFPIGLLFEDYPFHCEVMLTSKKSAIVRDHYYLRRRREGSVMADADEKFYDTVKISNIVTQIFKRHNLYQENIELVLNRKIEYLIYCYEEISNEFKNKYLKLLDNDFKKIQSNTIEYQEYLDNLNDYHKYFFLNIDKKLPYQNVNFLLNEYKLNGKNKNIPYINELNVAVILDPLSYNSFSPEFNAIVIEPNNWKEMFKNNNIDLLFCETAWDGVSSKYIENGIALENKESPWRNHVINVLRDSDKYLEDIVNYCKKQNIPTVFWNKENPHGFDEFVDATLMFDHIFTSDENCIIKYKSRGHKNVHQLLFASQIRLYNPICERERTNDIIFAGSWYDSFEERCKMMRELFDKINESKHKLKIYNRHSKRAETMPYWNFPDKYSEYVHPGVPSDKMADVYKESKYALNINTITESPTMFARRVFELMSSNTFVISNYSRGVDNLFGDNVLYLDKMDSLNLNEDEVSRICEENLYEVLENHTYYERFKYILDCIGLEYKEKINTVNVFYNLTDKNTINEIIEDFESITYHYKKCFIITNNTIKFSDNFNKQINIITTKDLFNMKLNKEHFFLFRNIKKELNHNFIRKALLHYKYIELNIGVKCKANKYTFSKSKNIFDVLFNSCNFRIIINNLYNNPKKEITVYHI